MPEARAVSDLAPLHAWFAAYCRSFRVADADVQRNYDLKDLHTGNVCEAAAAIARDWSPRRRMLGEVAALCHDLGRFPQYRDFGTFKDSESVNHARLSAEIMQGSDHLGFLSASERDSVITAVRLHNVYQIPDGLAAETEGVLRLVRDADKLDIWRIFIEYFRTPPGERPSGAGLGFPDLPTCSPEVLATVMAGSMVQLSTLKSLNDFKLLQLSWVYDLNFPETFRLVKERGVLEGLAETLPGDGAVLEVLDRVRGHLDGRLAAA